MARRDQGDYGPTQRELVVAELSALLRRRELSRNTLASVEARIKVLERMLRKGRKHHDERDS